MPKRRQTVLARQIIQADGFPLPAGGAPGPTGPAGPAGPAGAAGATGPAGPATTDASLLASGILPNARLANIPETTIADGAVFPRLAAAETIGGVWEFTTGIKERGRTAFAGEWVNIAYDAGRFSGNGGMTWTVGAGDQVGLAYMQIGKTCWVRFTLNGTTVGGVASSQLKLDLSGIPLAAVVNSSAIVRCFNAGVDGAGLAEIVGSSINFSLFTGSWTLVADNTSIQGSLMFTLA